MKSFFVAIYSGIVLLFLSLKAAGQEEQHYPFFTDPIRFCLPLKKLSLTSPFGYRANPVTGKCEFHSGIDLKADFDTVYAVLPGTVKTGYDNVFGIYIKISFGDLQLSYGHLSQVLVIPGATVEPGMPIAKSGATGRITGPHLHFSVRYRRQYLHPLKFLHQLLIINSNYHE
jgi:murein DD-endopeptidase MepM/ murein hydrolase activator NlpD